MHRRVETTHTVFRDIWLVKIRSRCLRCSSGIDFPAVRRAIMQTTRRTFLGSVGAAAALGVAGGVKIPEATAAPISLGEVPAASSEKVLFWVAASTPCSKDLKFDEELYKDVLAYLKSNGADGAVVLGTTGEFPSFSVDERKKVAETAFKHRNGLNIIVSPGTANFPETLELCKHAEDNG